MSKVKQLMFRKSKIWCFGKILAAAVYTWDFFGGMYVKGVIGKELHSFTVQQKRKVARTRNVAL